MLEEIIEAILFTKGEPVAFSYLAKICETDEASVREATNRLKEKLSGRGITLIEHENSVILGTEASCAPYIEKIFKEEKVAPLSRASLETLTVILYRGPVSKSDIDWIRGVNSQFTLRHLLFRGLVEKIENPKDARSYLYRPSIELLSHMGIKNISELPEFATYNATINESLKNESKKNNENS